MDLSDAAAYHGSTYSHRESPESGDYRGTLETAFLCTISGDVGGNPDEYQFLALPDVEAFNEEIRAYRNRLEDHGVETVMRESRYPNATYSADSYLGFGGDLYLSRMASEIRKPEELEIFAFAHERGYDPIVPFPSGEYFEISNAIPSNEGLVLGVGQRGTEAAAKRLASVVDSETTIVGIGDDVQHLMGALRPLPDGRAAIRPAKLEGRERLEQSYDGFLEFEESEEIVEKQAMNFTIAADETILMPNDTPEAETKLAETYNVETVSVNEIRKGAGGLACLTGRVD
jgi:N-dimethylarginine dimethylaminohydrolase